jgi:uncharacterized DUF497 family protein
MVGPLNVLHLAGFADPLGLLLEDEVHPERLALIAVSEKSRVLYTVFAEMAGDVIRIITARRATTHERRRYEEEGE